MQQAQQLKRCKGLSRQLLKRCSRQLRYSSKPSKQLKSCRQAASGSLTDAAGSLSVVASLAGSLRGALSFAASLTL